MHDDDHEPDDLPDDLQGLRDEIGRLNLHMLDLLSRRAACVVKLSDIKRRDRMDLFSPAREKEMLDALVAANQGPFPDEVVVHLFKQVFASSLALMEREIVGELGVVRRSGTADLTVPLGGAVMGEAPVLIAGPCAVEDPEQMEEVAAHLARRGVRILRAGAFKPRTSPYAFQGLGEEGLRLLQETARRHGLATVTEVTDIRWVDACARCADMLQVGARNMSNYELLRAVGAVGRPVLLKRGLAATLDEFLHAAEYVFQAGCTQIVLCERGIRTFERDTRFTLDISAVPLLKARTRVPVVVDVSHAAGRRDILAPLARAALAAGADGVMVEVHPRPHLARSDRMQQLDLPLFDRFLDSLAPWIPPA
jgi:3-deoxy-7-phosphoheptulonate synthase/chorismate mutase